MEAAEESLEALELEVCEWLLSRPAVASAVDLAGCGRWTEAAPVLEGELLELLSDPADAPPAAAAAAGGEKGSREPAAKRRRLVRVDSGVPPPAGSATDKPSQWLGGRPRRPPHPPRRG
mmetsp:Transcript_35002/g.70707  ORF Transcript_35002/g.70707 Transcript_35002/m.70707 type:complete len:119 (-) Transcript_35002:13-369(-)